MAFSVPSSLDLILIVFSPYLQACTLLIPLLCLWIGADFSPSPQTKFQAYLCITHIWSKCSVKHKDKRTSYSSSPFFSPQKSGRSFEVRAFSLKSPNSKEGWLPHKSLKVERKKSKNVFFLATEIFPGVEVKGWHGGWESSIPLKFTSTESEWSHVYKLF